MLDHVTKDVKTIVVTATLRDVVQKMATGIFRHLPVVDEAGRLVGILSDRDIRRLLPSPGSNPLEVERFVEETRVGDVMIRDVVTIDEEASMLDAVELVLQHRIGALPVVRGDEMVGILTQTDLLHAFAEHLGRNETLQIEEAPPAYLEPPTSAEQHRPLVFVVEPNEDLRRHLSSVLRAAEVDVTCFDGLEELSDHDGVETPDLILLSAVVHGGADPLEMLREGYPMTPVVMTREGHPRREDQRKGKGPLFLPCSNETLLARVRGEIGFNRWTHDLPVLTQPPPLPHRTATIDIDILAPRQALVVDSDPLTRRILAYHLRACGCDVTEAGDTKEGLAQLRKTIFDLVTVELDLPYGSGFEILEAVAGLIDNAPRVVVVAGPRRDDDVRLAFALGALDYVKKPLAPDEVEKRLRRALAE